MSPLSEKSWRYRLFIQGTAREANYMSKEREEQIASALRAVRERTLEEVCELLEDSNDPESAEFIRDNLKESK